MLSAFSYQVVFLGQQDARMDQIKKPIFARIRDLGLDTKSVLFLLESEAGDRNRRLPTIAIFLGDENVAESQHPVIAEFLDESLIIVTVVSDLKKVSLEIPHSLIHINAIQI